MTKKTTLDSLAALVSKGFTSADKKFTALAEDIARLDTKIDSVESKLNTKLDSVESNLAGKIGRLDTKLTKFEENEIDKRLQLEVRVSAIERHLGINKKIAA
jgi:septal ring factor EnvC (AmiA/AmiB activator)